MDYQADFLDGGQIKWTEVEHPATRRAGIQMAMFTDRVDLWPTVPKGRRPGIRPRKNQPELTPDQEERR